MSYTEIQDLGCRDQGNVVNANFLRFAGEYLLRQENFPCQGMVQLQ